MDPGPQEMGQSRVALGSFLRQPSRWNRCEVLLQVHHLSIDSRPSDPSSLQDSADSHLQLAHTSHRKLEQNDEPRSPNLACQLTSPVGTKRASDPAHMQWTLRKRKLRVRLGISES